jgi:hypothetical protein
MDARPCYVTDEAGTWPGRVLSWFKVDGEWQAVVRYGRPHESEHVLSYERWVRASAVTSR